MVSADDKIVVELHLSGGECHDAPEGRKSLETIGEDFPDVPVLMDRAYEGDETRELAMGNGHQPRSKARCRNQDCNLWHDGNNR